MALIKLNASDLCANQIGTWVAITCREKKGLCVEDTDSVVIAFDTPVVAQRLAEAISLAMDPGESVPEWIRTAAKEEDERNG